MRARLAPTLMAALVIAALAGPVRAVEPESAPPPVAEAPPKDPATTPRPLTTSGTDELARDSWIVVLAKDVRARVRAPGLAREVGGRVGVVYAHALNGFQLKGSAAAAAALRRNPN